MALIKRKINSKVSDGKPVKKQKLSSKAEPNLLAMNEEEPSFPRGGGSILTPLEHKQIQIQAKNDVLFEQKNGKQSVRYDSDSNGENANMELEDVEVVHTTAPIRKQKKPETKSALNEQSVRIEGLNYKVLTIQIPCQRCGA